VDEVGDHAFREQLIKVSRRKVLHIECTILWHSPIFYNSHICKFLQMCSDASGTAV
jgi:hypothetical protein